MIPSLFARTLVFGAAILLCAGCTLPEPAYRKVDQSSPAFKEAVTQETERQQANGNSAAGAEAKAIERVTRQFIQVEKNRRTERVAPLVQALAAFEQLRGCWAYTVTTTTRKEGKATVTVEVYDPFQPEERLWTLVSYDNGQAPDEKAQADYRKTKLRSWKKILARKKRGNTESEKVKLKAIYDRFEITGPSGAFQTTFIFNRDRANRPLAGEIPGERETYVVENGTLLHRTTHWDTDTKPSSMLAGTIKIDHFDTITDYMLIEPSLPPFVSKTMVRYRDWILGNDSGDVETENVYTDYHRVKCYDDRFETSVGPPDMIDFISNPN